MYRSNPIKEELTMTTVSTATVTGTTEECIKMIMEVMMKEPNREMERAAIKKAINPDGNKFTDGVVSGSLDSLLKKRFLVRVRYGVYAINPSNQEGEYVEDELTPIAINALREACQKINESAKNLNILIVEEEDLATLRIVKSITLELDEMISKLVKKAKDKEAVSKAKHQRVTDFGIQIERTVGWDMKAIWELHKAAEHREISLEELLKVLEENGWVEYYREVVKNPLI
jgi:hypothetical protein